MFKGSNQLSKALTGLLALYFICVGLFRLNDPQGFAFQLQSYIAALNLDALVSIALSLSLFITVVFLLLGAALLFGYYKRYAYLLAGILSVLSVITSILLLVAKDAGCGCYGETLLLPTWIILAKDVLILGLVVFCFKKEANLNIQKSLDNSKKSLFYVLVFSCLCIGLLTINFQPLLDFSSFKKGVDLRDHATKDREILYVLRNVETGEERRMLRDAYTDSELLGDTTWMLSETIERGALPTGGSFQILDMGGKNYRKEILENPFYNLVIVGHDVKKANIKALGNLNALSINLVEQFNTRTVLLTSSPEVDTEAFRKEYNFFPEIFFVDPSISKSMVRSNPGVLLMKNGIIVEKWHFNQVPEMEELVADYFNK